MVAARRIGRWLLYGMGACVAVVVLVRLGLGVYLNTPAGRAVVARKITAQIGMPVEVTGVRVGLFRSEIGMRVFDPAAADPAKSEVFAVDKADADVSLFNFATGHVAPQQVELHGVNLVLHVGADGKVLTTLPDVPSSGDGGGGVLPAVVLTDGRITIHQDGRPEFALEHLNLSVEPGADRVKLTGTIDDPLWSKWTVTGDVARAGKSGSVELATADGPLTMARFVSVPFVPPSVWKHVRADGRGAVAVKLWTATAGDVRYAVDIKPHAATLTLPDADATFTGVTGTIRVSGAKVTLADARGELAGGTVAVGGTFDFGPEPTVARFTVTADDLDIKRLPTEWNLPRDFEGKLKGTADLTLRVFADGRVEPEGGGEGVITGVKVLGFPGDDIPIHLRKAGNRYQFQQQKKTGRARPAHPPVACAQDKKPADPPAKADAPTTLDATIRLRDIDVAELLKKLDVKLDYTVAGKVMAEAAVTVPVSGATSGAAYKFVGKLSSPALTLQGLVIRDIAANMAYQDGKFALTELSGKIAQSGDGTAPPGTFRGTLGAAIKPPGDVTADLTIDRLPLGELLKALPAFDVSVGGTVDGKVAMKAPYAKLSDTGEWSGSGDLKSSELVIAGRAAKDVHLAAAVAKGVASLSEATVTLEGIPVRAAASLTLSGKYPFTATVRTTGTDVTDLRRLVPEAKLPAPVEGVLDTQTTVTGTASPLAFDAAGTIKADKLTLGRSRANHLDAQWELTRDKLSVPKLKADVFGGSVTGSADVPFAPDKTGAFAVAFKDVDAGLMAELVPDFSVKLGGKVSGTVGGKIPPARDGQARVGNLDVDITAPKLTVQGIPADRLAGKATVRAGAVEYELEGKTLGGSFEVKGRYPGQKKGGAPAAPDAPAAVAPPGPADRGSLRLTGIDLSRLGAEAGFRSLAPLAGKLDAAFDFDNDFAAGTGKIRLLDLRWGDGSISREVVGGLVLRDGVFQLADLRGRVAGGDLRGRARVVLAEPRRNSFGVVLEGADAKRLLAPLLGGEPAGGSPRAAAVIDGPLTVAVRGRVGRELRASGTVALSRGTVSGVPVTDLHVPFEFAQLSGGYGEVTVREASVSAGSGRARAELTANWGAETRLQGQIRFLDVPVKALSPQLAESGLHGRLTGRFDLSGTNVRSAADVTGTLVAALNNTSVTEVPILRQATPFLNPTGLVKPFQSGDVRGTLSGGVFRVERLALANPGAQLYADGTVSTSGRVDLNVVAHTGSLGPEAPGLRLLGVSLPAFGPLPLTFIQTVSDFFSNRTVRLTITGTTDNPVVRVNVAALLSEEAIRFLLAKYVVPAEAAGALGLGYGFGSSGSKK